MIYDTLHLKNLWLLFGSEDSALPLSFIFNDGTVSDYEFSAAAADIDSFFF